MELSNEKLYPISFVDRYFALLKFQQRCYEIDSTQFFNLFKFKKKCKYYHTLKYKDHKNVENLILGLNLITN